MTIVSVKDVHKIYPLGKTEVHAVKGVNFDITAGDFISIAGPSGSGKSTILNMIGCIDTPSEGSVEIDGTVTNGMKDDDITRLRHRMVGFIFQNFNLVPVLNVYENIEFPLLLDKSTMGDKKERKEWIDYLIKEVGLDQWRDHKPNELSGGQRQRVAIARSLATKPRIVLADEPTANLDSKTGENILGLMKKVNEDLGTTFIFSTHDQTVVDMANHVIRLRDGKIVKNERKG